MTISIIWCSLCLFWWLPGFGCCKSSLMVSENAGPSPLVGCKRLPWRSDWHVECSTCAAHPPTWPEGLLRLECADQEAAQNGPKSIPLEGDSKPHCGSISSKISKIIKNSLLNNQAAVGQLHELCMSCLTLLKQASSCVRFAHGGFVLRPSRRRETSSEPVFSRWCGETYLSLWCSMFGSMIIYIYIYLYLSFCLSIYLYLSISILTLLISSGRPVVRSSSWARCPAKAHVISFVMAASSTTELMWRYMWSIAAGLGFWNSLIRVTVYIT